MNDPLHAVLLDRLRYVDHLDQGHGREIAAEPDALVEIEATAVVPD